MAEMFMIGNNGIMQPCVEHPELPRRVKSPMGTNINQLTFKHYNYGRELFCIR